MQMAFAVSGGPSPNGARAAFEMVPAIFVRC